MDEMTFTLNSPITEEQWDMIEDVDFDHTDSITFHTKHGKEVEFVKRKTGKWTTEEVAELLFNLFGEDCACNFNGIDEWLPERCKYAESTCPDPEEKHGCWMQFLLQGGADMRETT